MRLLYFSFIAGLLLTGFAVSAVSVREVKEYLPIARKLNAGDIDGAVADCRRIVDRNIMAAETIYLVLTRGYDGKTPRYAEAMPFWDRLVKDEQWLYQWELRLMREGRYPATEQEKSFRFRGRDGVTVTVPLRGSYPLRNCYAEEMRAIGGIGNIVPVFHRAGGFNQGDDAAGINALLKENGSPVLLERLCGTINGDVLIQRVSPEDRKALRAGADAGYLPAKVVVASLLLRNESNIPRDIPEADRLLKQVFERCDAYRKIGCNHADEIRKLAELVARSVPDVAKSTPELLRSLNGRYNDRRLVDAVHWVVAQRDDDPDCEYFRSFFLPPEKKAEAKKMVRRAAERGGHHALSQLYVSGAEPDLWYFYYLGGKFNIARDFSRMRKDETYYDRALSQLNSDSRMIDKDARLGMSYHDALKLLAEVHAPARERYNEWYGEEGKHKEFLALKVSHPDIIQYKWVKFQDFDYLLFEVAPSSFRSYVDIELKPRAQKGMFRLETLYSHRLPKGKIIWLDFLLADGETARNVKLGSSRAFRTRPVRIRINLAAHTESFQFYYRGF